MDRRNFLQGFALFSMASFADQLPQISQKNERAVENLGLTLLQGFTDETATQFAVDVPLSMIVHYEALELTTGRRYAPIWVKPFTRSFSTWRIDHVRFEGLQLESGYELLVYTDGNLLIDRREFSLLDTKKVGARIALLSCMLDYNVHRNQMWDMVLKQEPDMLFFLGDNVYGDIFTVFHSPSILWSRYLQTRNTLPIYRTKKLIPTIAIWDDHDFGKNDVDGHYKFKSESLQTFRSFYAQEPLGRAYGAGPGISSSFEGFGQKFIFMDNRYWRGLRNSYDQVGFMGEVQLDWLAGELQHAGQMTWILQGSQFYGSYKKSSGTYEGKSPDEFSYFMRLLRGHGKPCCFVSGDVHFSEVTRVGREFLGYDSYEITSSCLHSFLHKPLPDRKNRLAGALRENFILLHTTALQSDIKLACFGRGYKNRFNLDLAV